MRGDPVPHPRKIGKHVAAIIDALADGGASQITVWKTRHVIVGFNLGQHYFEVRTACTPRNEDDAINNAMQALRRTLGGALLVQLASGQ
jgi:hypothetical protein